jgi:serine/threonine protein phosphatase PrpC
MEKTIVPNLPPAPEQKRTPGELQTEPLVPAQEMPGFDLAEVYFTLEKKERRKYSGDHNEDNVLVDPATGLMGVMDGLGAHGRGDLASKTVERQLPEVFSEELAQTEKMSNGEVGRELFRLQNEKMGGLATPERRAEAEGMIKKTLTKDPALARKTLALLLAVSRTHELVKLSGGLTTACVSLLHKTPDGMRYAIVANVGDSGAFIRRKDGNVERVTAEDSAEEMLTRYGIKTTDGLDVKTFVELRRDPVTGKVANDLDIYFPITPESIEAMSSEETYEDMIAEGKDVLHFKYGDLKSNVTAALGHGSKAPIPSLEIVRLHAGDELILASDGLIDKYESMSTGETDYAELANDMAIGTSPTERLDNLRFMAKRRKTFKKDDDIALVSAHIK